MLPISDLDPCLDVLSSGTEVQPSDQRLCSLVRSQVLIEDASSILGWRNGRLLEDFDDPSTQYKMDMLKRRLESSMDAVPKEIDSREFFLIMHCSPLLAPTA